MALLHNSIYARGMLADELGGLAWARLTGQAGVLQWLRLEQALPLRLHLRPRDRGRGGADHRPETADPRLAGLNRRATAVCLGAEIWRDGRLIGHARTELYVEIRDGQAWPGGGAAQDFMLMRGGMAMAEPLGSRPRVAALAALDARALAAALGGGGPMNIIVIGAGIIGLTTARALLADGR